MYPALSYGYDSHQKDRVYQPEDDEFLSTPYNDYGEFNNEDEETEDISFFQSGRFFGVSIGSGFEGVSGNRGLLWQGGFPMIDFRVHYWFSFNMALDLGFFNAPHYYDAKNVGDHVEAKMFNVGANVKYYFDTKNLSAAVSFANPYIMIGGGAFTKTESTSTEESQESDTSVGLSVGGGLEFAIKPKKIYLSLEGKLHFVHFKDTFSEKFKTSNSIADMTGTFYTVTTSILFTW